MLRFPRVRRVLFGVCGVCSLVCMDMLVSACRWVQRCVDAFDTRLVDSAPMHLLVLRAFSTSGPARCGAGNAQCKQRPRVREPSIRGACFFALH